MIIAYVDAGTVAAVGAAVAGGVTGVKALVTAKMFGRRKDDKSQPSPDSDSDKLESE